MGGSLFDFFQYFGSNSSKNLKNFFRKKFFLYLGQENHFVYKNFSVAPKLALQIEITIFFGDFLPRGGRLKKGVSKGSEISNQRYKIGWSKKKKISILRFYTKNA